VLAFKIEFTLEATPKLGCSAKAKKLSSANYLTLTRLSPNLSFKAARIGSVNANNSPFRLLLVMFGLRVLQSYIRNYIDLCDT
jgi:hypothetical protein